MKEDEVIAALYKRAMGFNTEEEVEEYSVNKDDGRMELVKKKTNIKYVPPDISAAKALLGYLKAESETDTACLSDEELENKIKELEEEVNE